MPLHFLIEKVLCGNKDIEENNTIIMINSNNGNKTITQEHNA